MIFELVDIRILLRYRFLRTLTKLTPERSMAFPRLLAKRRPSLLLTRSIGSVSLLNLTLIRLVIELHLTKYSVPISTLKAPTPAKLSQHLRCTTTSLLSYHKFFLLVQRILLPCYLALLLKLRFRISRRGPREG